MKSCREPLSCAYLESVTFGRSAPLFESDEGAEPGDSLTDNQVLHLIGALVGVQRFGIREKPCRLIVGNDSVATENLACPCHGFPALRRGECLGQRRMGVSKLAFGMQLSLAHDQALRSRDVGDHLCEQILDQLERSDWPAELQALLAVLECRFVRPYCTSGRHPGHCITRHLQDP